VSGIFGPDRDDAPGITPQVGKLPPQFTDMMVESAAIHSRSQGWLPCVVIRLATEDGAGLVGTVVVGRELAEFSHSLSMAAARAVEDVKVGLQDGTLP
jgi:hypothetical protein